MKNDDRAITSAELAARWGVKEGSIRMLRVQGRGPRWFTLGRKGKGKRPRVRYWLSEVERHEREYGKGKP